MNYKLKPEDAQPNPEPSSNEAISKETSGNDSPSNRQHSLAETNDSDEESKVGFPIVGIGASAGGLEALEELFEKMPVDTGMAFVVVTHQHPGHTSMLPQLLGRKTKIPVEEAVDGVLVQPNHIYVGTPGSKLAILKGTLHRLEAGQESSSKLPIDQFFQSLAEDQQENAICIVLSGTGSDGTLGLMAVKDKLGMAMVEQPQSAKYSGMPSSAISTGQVDYVLKPAEMPAQLVAYHQRPNQQDQDVAGENFKIPDEPIQKIFMLLRVRTGNDFSSYKSNTLRRRIERRMNVHQITEPNRYIRYLQENPHEIDLLFQELLISVTGFFRDQEAWEALQGPLNELIESRPEDYTFRAWIPGCATGEEVFSLAIQVRESMQKAKRQFDVQLFGTDLDSNAIETARASRYPDRITGDLSPARLERYFTRSDGHFRVNKEIREMTVFAPQNVIKDPPFTKLDMISCRNLLIYLNAEIQKKLLPIFHYSLKPGGLLFLGPSETIGAFTDLFEPVDKRWKIFRRRECATAAIALPIIPAQTANRNETRSATPMEKQFGPDSSNLSAILERLLLARFAPPCVVVNDRGDILHIQGRTGAYLEPAQGKPRHNILEMAREGLRMELTIAIRQCSKDGNEITRESVRIKSNGDFLEVGLTVSRLDDPVSVRGLLLVTFRPVGPSSKPTESMSTDAKAQMSLRDHDARLQLETELQHIRESHQTTLEELETSNEELKSANEELQSTNEELQSTNEELETSKEEMQSLNEELTTVNVELQSKVDDLSQANDDMQNLLNSTNIATVFLDQKLNIRRFTEHVKGLVMLRESDIGRPIDELASNLDPNSLVSDCRDVLKTLVARESEITTKAGGDYLMRVMPYRTIGNVIDGLVITFVNIGPLKKAQRLGEAKALFESVVATVRQPLLVLDDANRIVTVNRCFLETFRLSLGGIQGKSLFEIGNEQWNVPELRKLLGEILPKDQIIENFAMEHEFHGLGYKRFVLNARRLEQDTGRPGMILLAMEDSTNKEQSGT